MRAFLCIYVCFCLCARPPYVCVCACVSACANFFMGVYIDSMIYFQAICSKVGMAFNLAPLRRSQEKKKSLLIQYVLHRGGVRVGVLGWPAYVCAPKGFLPTKCQDRCVKPHVLMPLGMLLHREFGRTFAYNLHANMNKP